MNVFINELVRQVKQVFNPYHDDWGDDAKGVR